MKTIILLIGIIFSCTITKGQADSLSLKRINANIESINREIYELKKIIINQKTKPLKFVIKSYIIESKPQYAKFKDCVFTAINTYEHTSTFGGENTGINTFSYDKIVGYDQYGYIHSFSIDIIKIILID